jgi:acyl-CoA thioester hydrolase
MYFKEFEVRWSDLDGNMHLANSAYINFMSHTRMSFLLEQGISLTELQKLGLGPIAFSEQIFYFKEVFGGSQVRVSLELQGLSEDGRFFQFLHNFYDTTGRNLARCTMLGGWIDTHTRKLVGLPPLYLERFQHIPKSKDFQVLTKENTRLGMRPEDL